LGKGPHPVTPMHGVLRVGQGLWSAVRMLCPVPWSPAASWHGALAGWGSELRLRAGTATTLRDLALTVTNTL